MAERWVEELVRGWDDQIPWTDTELDRLSPTLTSIADANRGTIHMDMVISDEEKDAYRGVRVAEALDAYASSVWRQVFDGGTPRCPVPTDDFDAALPFVEAMKLVDRVDINRADEQALADLPGIGPVTAGRIIEYREDEGGIRHVSELRHIRGLDADKVRLFANKVFIRLHSTDTPRPRVGTHNGATLPDAPGFGDYVRFLRVSGLRISRHGSGTDDLKELIVEEIEGIRAASASAPALYPCSTGTRASAVASRLARDARLAAHEAEHGDENVHGVRLRDSGYAGFVLELLKSAQTRIWLMVFFFRFEDEPPYPTDPLMAELLAARERGIDVKVVLDHQDEDDPRPSSVVNEAAFDYLTEHGVPVRYDTDERVTHSKLLLVDDDHVVVGSHNWTAGSIFVYHDISFYVRSPEVASSYRARFESLWGAYEPDGP